MVEVPQDVHPDQTVDVSVLISELKLGDPLYISVFV